MIYIMFTALALMAAKVVGDVILTNFVLGVTTGVTVWTAGHKASSTQTKKK